MHTQTKSHSNQPRYDRVEKVRPFQFIERLQRVIEARLAELKPIVEEARRLEEELAAYREAD